LLPSLSKSEVHFHSESEDVGVRNARVPAGVPVILKYRLPKQVRSEPYRERFFDSDGASIPTRPADRD